MTAVGWSIANIYSIPVGVDILGDPKRNDLIKINGTIISLPLALQQRSPKNNRKELNLLQKILYTGYFLCYN